MSIIKKILSVILIAALCAGVALAEQKHAADDFLGQWQDLNGIRHIAIQPYAAAGLYQVRIRMDMYDGEKYGYYAWYYGCAYGEEAGALRSFFRATGTGYDAPDHEEEITAFDPDFSGASFFFDDAGHLVWSDESEGLDDGMVFLPV